MIFYGQIVENREIVDHCFRMWLDVPEIARCALPGQFLHIRCSDSLDPLLRRPLSIHAVDQKKGKVALLYRVVGRGTSFLARKKVGEGIDLMGPLGRGFSLPVGRREKGCVEEEKGTGHAAVLGAVNIIESVAVVGGGIGIAPLFFLLQELSRKQIPVHVFFGARTRQELYLLEEIKKFGFSVHTATDDGSLGRKGTVISLLEEKLWGAKPNKEWKGREKRNYLTSELPTREFAFGRLREGSPFRPNFIYGCGPKPMLKELARLLNRLRIPGEISLEERMGCGVGVCLSCVCKVRDVKDNKDIKMNTTQTNISVCKNFLGGEARQGNVEEKFSYRRVCTEGPVFSISEVVF